MAINLPPDIFYGLECSTECFHITEDVYAYYRRFNQINIVPLIDRYDERRPDVGGDGLLYLSRLYARPYQHWFWNHARPTERAWCLVSASQSFGRKSAECIDHLLSKYISAMLSQGRDPYNKRVMGDWLDQSSVMIHVTKQVSALGARLRLVTADMFQHALTRPDRFALLLPTPHDMDEPLPWDMVRDQPIIKKSLVAKKRQKQISVLKKSASFLSRLIGTNDVAMFVSGKEITVEGERFTFALTKASILSENHGGMTIKVHDKKTNHRLFDLCWYVERTPTLDQIAALVMAVRSGNEQEIIDVGNRFKVDYDLFDQQPDLYNGLGIYRPIISSPVYPSNNFLQTLTGNLVDRETVDDRLMFMFPGTSEYRKNNPELYRIFARRCAKRWVLMDLPTEITDHFIPHAPETIRPFTYNQVGRELLQQRQTRQQEILAA